MKHAVSHVEDGSVADQLGIRPGDLLMTMNGRPVADLIDYQAFSGEERMNLVFERGGEEMEYAFEKDEYEPLGLQFENMLMSPQRDCVNRCLFCFVDQLPERARPSLRVKDDDWRMSLMMGSFVTLTNVSDAEFRRIIDRRCAPLYISVHATNPALRAELLGQKRGAAIMDQLTALKDAGLSFHAQAVLCPGLNDGAELDRTISDLAGLYPAALSLALVPVGLTAHRDHLTPIKPFDRGGAAAALDQADRWRKKLRKELGTSFVFPADELYLMAGRAFPSDASYEDYPQIENGVGLCRLLETEYVWAWEAGGAQAAPERDYAIACGASAAPFLRDLLARYPVAGAKVTVYPLINTFFGESVTVSGLLTGGDLIRQLAGVSADRVLISSAMLREGEDVFLDDVTVSQVESALGRNLESISGGEALYRALAGPAEG